MVNKARLIETFSRYAACASESGNERAMCELVELELQALGLTIKRDEVGPQCGSDGWNIYGYLPGVGEPILFSAHVDTVPPGVGVQAVVEDGVIRSAGNTVLGADDKAGLAAIMEALAVVQEQNLPHRPIEVLFTICEELGLLGAKYADYTNVQSKQALVLDNSTPGEMVSQAPAKLVVHVTVQGKSAHAAMAPERGVNAIKAAALAIANIPTGRVDAGAIINVANFLAPGKNNIVPEKACFDLDMRAFEKAHLQAHLVNVKTALHNACKQMGATWRVEEDWQTESLRISPDSAVLAQLKQVYETLDIPWKTEKTFGNSDAAWIHAKGGMDVVNIGTGMMDVHSTDEHIKVADLVSTAQVALGMMVGSPSG